MLRIYDARTGRPEPVVTGGRGGLRLHVHGPAPATGPAGKAGPADAAGSTGVGEVAPPVGELRSWLLADLIRRAVEREGLRVIVSQDVAGDGAEAFWAGLITLNIWPAEYSAQPPDSVDLVVDLPPPGHESGPEQASAAAGPATAGAPPAGAPAARPATAGGPATGGPAAGGAGTGPATAGRRVRSGPARFAGAAVPASAAAEPSESAEPAVRLSDLADRGLDPLALRLAFLERPYQQPLDLGWDALEAADAELRQWRRDVAAWAGSPSAPIPPAYLRPAGDAVDDDLDTPAALRELRALARDEAVPPGGRFETFAHLDRVLGLDLVRDVGRA